VFDIMMNIIYYSLAAFAMGVLWYAVLFPFADAVPLGGEVWFVNLLAMCFASLSVALLFRVLIIRAKGWLFHALAISLPMLGAFLFGTYMVLGWHLHALTHPGISIDWHDAIKIPLIFVLFGAWGLFFISVPMGYLSQWLMQLIGKTGPRGI
jgi:hypothetical protein